MKEYTDLDIYHTVMLWLLYFFTMEFYRGIIYGKICGNFTKESWENDHFPICLYSLPMDPKFSSIKVLHCICFHSTFIKIDKISSTM